jgi:hypothetical protein
MKVCCSLLQQKPTSRDELSIVGYVPENGSLLVSQARGHPFLRAPSKGKLGPIV